MINRNRAAGAPHRLSNESGQWKLCDLVVEGVSLVANYRSTFGDRLQDEAANNLALGRDVDETLRRLSALQFCDEHGEVCPAGWRQGGDGNRSANCRPEIRHQLRTSSA